MDVVASAELAGHSVERARAQNGAAVELETSIRLDVRGVDVEFRHRHRGNRPHVVGIENAQHRAGDFGKFVVDLEMDARREKREGFEHALDVRVFALIGLDEEARGDLGVLAGKFRAHLAQEGQLAFVVEQQIVTHRALHPPDIHRSKAAARYQR